MPVPSAPSAAAAVALLALMSAAASAQPPAGDPVAGEKIFMQCKACHSLEPGKKLIGPSLAGVIGRKAGTVEGFSYSPAMKNADVTWTPENIDKYLADPKGFIPGNKMAFNGLKKPEDRQNVIAYIAGKGGTRP
ncbi:MAG: cytochrome c family protein [Magnetospirillum sp.]|nr:cytochrome c family protein [Magnetospirillum sp.]